MPDGDGEHTVYKSDIGSTQFYVRDYFLIILVIIPQQNR